MGSTFLTFAMWAGLAGAALLLLVAALSLAAGPYVLALLYWLERK